MPARVERLACAEISISTPDDPIRQQVQRIRTSCSSHRQDTCKPAWAPAAHAFAALKLQLNFRAYRADMPCCPTSACSHYPHRQADRAAEPGAVLPPHLRRQQDPHHQGPSSASHSRSLLKDLHVPARDIQIILGHTMISTTLEIYTDVDEQAKRDALTQLHGLLDQGETEPLLQTVATEAVSAILETGVSAGAPGRIRTCDRLLRRQLLCPAELQAPGLQFCTAKVTRLQRSG